MAQLPHVMDLRYLISATVGKGVEIMATSICVPKLIPKAATNSIELREGMVAVIDKLGEVAHPE